jgi:hypothetical protein
LANLSLQSEGGKPYPQRLDLSGDYTQMTNSKQVIGNNKRGGNKKDWGHQQRRTQVQQFLDLGFVQVDCYKFTYTWSSNFPTFRIAPGIVGVESGLVARYERYEPIEILFPYGTLVVDIKDRLDCEIFAIMKHDATIDDLPLDWQSSVEEIDIDAWVMAVIV